MSEEITIKISAEMLSDGDGKAENREIDIKINQDDTVNDLIKKIKEHKELVEGQKYLMITFDNETLTNSTNTNLFQTLKHYGIKNNSVLKVDLLPPGENCKPKNLQYWVDISDEIDIKIKKPNGGQKEISLDKNKKCSDLVELIKNDKDITGDNKYFLLMFGGRIITESDNIGRKLKDLNVKDQSIININFGNEPMSDKWVEVPKYNENKQKCIENINLNTSKINSLNLAQNTEIHHNKDVTSKIGTPHNDNNQYHEDDEFGCLFRHQMSLRSRLWFSFKLIFLFTFVGKYPVSYKKAELSSRIRNKIIRFFIAVLLIVNIPMLALGVAFLCLSMLTKLAIAMTVVGTFLSVIFVCSCFVISAKLNSKISNKELKTLNEFPAGYSARDAIIPITEDVIHENTREYQ